jgi:RHS repeat-associated protein
MQAWGYSGNARTLPKTRVWGSEPENLHCSSATAPLKIELRWGCEESSSKTAVGSGVSFKYDPFGRRIYKSSSTATSIYAYDGDNLIEEVNSSGTAVARYSQTQNIDEPLAILRSATTSYYHADGLGTTTSLSNAAGTLAQTYTFDSFGKQTASSGSLTNPFQYTGRELDSETGLYYMRARYYDPSAGRFLSEDPSDFNGGINFYAYVANDPVNWNDPLGLDRLSYDQIANLVANNNASGQSDELIICMAYKESTFDPDAALPGSQSARGLLGVTDSAATDAGFDYADLGDPATNIDAGSTYLGIRIHRNHGNVRNGLIGYGTGKPYANSLLNCEKCLVTRAGEKSECKTKDCLEPLHPAPKPKPHPRPKPRHPRRPKP